MATGNQNQKLDETRWLDPASLMKLKSLELQVKLVVEGFLLGLHKSPFHGFSAEFTEYRPYVEGDDTRYMDWKLYARTDRYYIKKFREETNVRTYFVLDQSNSMSYSSLEWSKMDYARLLVGSLGYFILKQRDAVGACRFDSGIQEYLPPAVRVGQLRKFLKLLHSANPGKQTQLGVSLNGLANLVKAKSKIVMVSDFLGDLEVLKNELKILSARGHEISLVQILDPKEITWNQNESLLLEDMENGKSIFVNGKMAAQRYQVKLDSHLAALQKISSECGLKYNIVSTESPLDQVCYHYVRSESGGWLPPKNMESERSVA